MIYSATVKSFVSLVTSLMLNVLSIPGHPVLQQQPAIREPGWELVRKAKAPPVQMMETFVMVVKAVMRIMRPVYPPVILVKGILCVTKIRMRV
jgi:hypothetical protein